jgi:hypothetical protein
MAARDLAENEDVKEFYLGLSTTGRKNLRDVKHYRRRKRWLSDGLRMACRPPEGRRKCRILPRRMSA